MSNKNKRVKKGASKSAPKGLTYGSKAYSTILTCAWCLAVAAVVMVFILMNSGKGSGDFGLFVNLSMVFAIAGGLSAICFGICSFLKKDSKIILAGLFFMMIFSISVHLIIRTAIGDVLSGVEHDLQGIIFTIAAVASALLCIVLLIAGNIRNKYKR